MTSMPRPGAEFLPELWPELLAEEMRTGVRQLTGYAQSCFPQDRAGQKNMALKLDHSLRVFQEAQTLVKAENIPAHLARTALFAALFHDIGRFAQYVQYQTFNDRESVNHARLAVSTLKQLGFLDHLAEKDRKVVLSAVILHNRRFLPPHLPKQTVVPAWIVRDADKLDIYMVMIQHLQPGAEINPVVTLGLRDEPDRYNEDLLDQILAGELGDYNRMGTLNDFRLLLCSWVFDLNFATARQALHERGYLQSLLKNLPDTDRIRQFGQKIRQATLAAGGDASALRPGTHHQEVDTKSPEVESI
jgi:hypothetical protein